MSSLTEYSDLTLPEIIALQAENFGESREIRDYIKALVNKRLAKVITQEQYLADHAAATTFRLILHARHERLHDELAIRVRRCAYISKVG